MTEPAAAEGERDLTGRRFALGAALASLAIVLFSAAAVTAAVLLEVEDTKQKFFAAAPPALELGQTVTRAEAGRPRTFLILGSDRRVGDEEIGRKPLSDTIVLVRADPSREAITVMSVPRDLKVELPGYGVGRINAAYQQGGPKGTLEALKSFFASAGAPPFQVNHVLNLDFGGFRRAVDYIGGVYVDVDRDYFNDNSPPVDSLEPYATIDVDAGYQRLRGQDALDYVRFRHLDDDFVRAARQQDFLRQLRSQPSVRRLLRLQARDRLARVFGRYVQVDKSFRSTKTLLSLLKLGAYLRDARIRTIRFPGVITDGGLHVEAAPEDVREALDRFLHPPKPTATGPREPSPRSGARARGSEPDFRRDLEDFRGVARGAARVAARRVGFPVRYPSLRVPGSRLEEDPIRTYSIGTRSGRRHGAYRYVMATGRLGEFYGVQGTAWRTPPILENPDRIRIVGGRRLLLFTDGGRLRLVGWRTPDGAYWVSNTLNRALSAREMIGLALSVTRVGG